MTVNLNATIGHDCRIGTFATVAPGANNAGKVILSEGSEVGLNGTVVRGVTLGEWSSVGPGSVVIKDVPALARLFGNPARTLSRVGC